MSTVSEQLREMIRERELICNSSRDSDIALLYKAAMLLEDQTDFIADAQNVCRGAIIRKQPIDDLKRIAGGVYGKRA